MLVREGGLKGAAARVEQETRFPIKLSIKTRLWPGIDRLAPYS